MMPAAATAAPAMSTQRNQPRTSPVSRPAPRNGSSARRLAICSRSSIEPQFDRVEPMLTNMMRLLTPTKMHANVTFCGRISAGEVMPLSHHVAPTVAPSGLSLADGQFVGIGFAVDEDRVTVADVTGEQRPCQAVTDRLLDEPAQRAGAVCRVPAGERKPLASGIGHLEGDPSGLQPCAESSELQIDDVRQFVRPERIKHDDLIEPVEA